MKKQQQLQQQKQLTAYERKAIHDIFRDMMEVLEKYIEKSGYYSDWSSRKQIYDDNVKRQFDSPEEVESVFSVNLYGLKLELKNRPPFFLEELKEEFYQWVNAAGIDVNNCPERLKQILFKTHEVLEGGGDKFAETTAKEAREHVEKMSEAEFSRKINEAFASFQTPLQKERKEAESLEGKSYKDIEIKSKFSGNVEQGQEAFGRIAGTVSGHDEFQFYSPHRPTGSQHWTNNSEIISDIRQNPRSWRVDEIITEFDNRGGTRQENVLIHQSANLNDYNQQTGKLNFDENAIYRADRFSPQEQAQINQALNVSQQPAQVQQPPYKWSWS